MAVQRVCSWCGTPFKTNTKRKLHCCTKCKDISYRHGYRYCTICGVKYEITPRYVTHSQECDDELLRRYAEQADKYPCKSCETLFPKEHPNQRFCCARCKEKEQNERSRKGKKLNDEPRRKHEPASPSSYGMYIEQSTYYSTSQYNPLS